MRAKLRRLLRSGKGRASTPSDADRLAEWVRSGRVTVGARTYGSPRIVSMRGDATRVEIGSYCSISEEVEIFLGGNHRHDWASTFPFRAQLGLPGAFEDGMPATRGDVRIGHDVWIGRGATILSGITIGNGAVVGARAVVAKDVRPYAIVVGNPGREIARRFDDETVDRFERVAWWTWPEDKIVEHIPLLSSDRIDEFLRSAELSP